ncbi:MAG: aminopeptidase [Bacteroidetes bacterium]|nr:aminopeptidase [Bacteroidota bacterium]
MKKFLIFLALLSTEINAQKLSVASLGLKPPVSIRCTPVKDQNLSSTCWSFSSNSFLESEMMKQGKGTLDLSEMFVARYSMIRKIKRHLELKGQNYFTPGGQFHDAAWVLKNYGMIPESVYSGKGRGESLPDHSEMDTVLKHFVEKNVADGITTLSEQQQYWVDSVLDYYYGVVPKTFTYQGKSYTPQSYLKDYLKINPEDYVEITSYTHHPFYTKFVLEDKYNWTGDAYYNVPLADFNSITQTALKNGYTVGWDGDADDPYFDYYGGLAYMPNRIADFQKERQTAFETQATLLDHMMHIVGMTKDKKENLWYYIKNSWGNNTNAIGGFVYMRDDYFKIRTVAIIVNKKAIPASIRKKIEQ